MAWREETGDNIRNSGNISGKSYLVLNIICIETVQRTQSVGKIVKSLKQIIINTEILKGVLWV